MADHDFDEACRLVGRFLHAFARIEAAIDAGVATLLGADGRGRVVLAGVLPFVKKVDVLLATERETAMLPDENRAKLLRSTSSLLKKLNNSRVLAAHSAFEPFPGGLRFEQLKVTDGKVRRSSIEWTAATVEAECAEAEKAIELVGQVIDGFEPFVMSLDFRDPRNAAMAAALSI